MMETGYAFVLLFALALIHPSYSGCCFYDSADNCFCDTLCTDLNDCCSDYTCYINAQCESCPVGDCGALTSEADSYASVSTPDGTAVGQMATYTCNTGYEPFSGDVTRTCQDDGQWDGAPLTCALIACSGCKPSNEVSCFDNTTLKECADAVVCCSPQGACQCFNKHCPVGSFMRDTTQTCTHCCCPCGCVAKDETCPSTMWYEPKRDIGCKSVCPDQNPGQPACKACCACNTDELHYRGK